ncbi:histidine--tRNA ligase [Myxococcota bacterium]|nr:histidine--tRNA ligase [Myxococcota bacterium]MBU1410310.1 histidine--tRNA ligase [Myxococcota bacterium]MBU1509780.1 histidine--tRNA ligase [Myxococcota bacterium]
MSTKAPLPPTGTRDFLPDAVRRRRHVQGIISRCFERHGYEPLETPAMERLEVLLGKYGEEGDKLLFKVLHRGDKLKRVLESSPVQESDLTELGLRYDLTVPLARVAANYPEQLTRVFKRYQIQPVWRADRPAKGRFREFFQCDVDILGSQEILAELDIFSAIGEIMDELGLRDFELHINHRKWLSGLLSSLAVPASEHATVLGVLDKLDKVGPQAVLVELGEKNVSEACREQLPRLFDAFLAGRPQPEAFASRVADQAGGPEAMGQLQSVLAWDGPRGGRIVWNPLLARGLDYYTGLIYELRIPPWPSSFGGGGRYDNLIGMFSARPVPAVGFSFGLERVLDILEERGLFPEFEGHARAVVGVLDPAVITWALDAVSGLRAQGLSVDLFPEITAVGKVMKWVDRKKVKYVLLMGSNEMESGTVSWKNLQTGDGGSVPLAEISSILR